MTMITTNMTPTITRRATMTTKKQFRWLPTLLVAPIAAGVFGATTSWALSTEPPTTAPAASSSTASTTVDGVPAATSAKLASNQETITQLETRLTDLRAQVDALNAQTASISSSSVSSSGSAPSSSSSRTGTTATTPAPAPVAPSQSYVAPPPTNSTSGAS